MNEIKERLTNKKVVKEVSSDGDGSDYKEDEEDNIDEKNGKKMRIVWYTSDNFWIDIESVFFILYFVVVKIDCPKLIGTNCTNFFY